MALPKIMKVIDVPRPGGPEALIVARCEVPVPREHEVLIAVEAAGLNRADVLQRRGLYPPPAGAPAWPGLEVAGRVVATGRAVSGLEPGAAVCALLQGGGYAEYCTVDEGQVLPVPGSLNMVEAASLPEAAFTVWANVFELGRLQSGESLLVHGGASGIGVFAIQLAAALGHAVLATAGSQERSRFCEQLGAARGIDYRSEDFVDVVTTHTGGRGVDVVLDMVGGSYLARNLQVLATGGRLVMIAAQGGTRGEADVLRIMQRRLTVTGSTLRARPVEFKRTIRARLLETVWPLVASGRIRPIVDASYALEEAGHAHAHMESGRHKGKIVLLVGEGHS